MHCVNKRHQKRGNLHGRPQSGHNINSFTVSKLCRSHVLTRKGIIFWHRKLEMLNEPETRHDDEEVLDEKDKKM